MDANTIISNHLFPLLLAFYLGFSGYRKKSLDLSGALSAMLVGYFTLSCGLFETIVLLFFFYSSSKLTKYKSDIKKLREDGFVEGEGHRNWEQVLANGGFPTLLCLLSKIWLSATQVGSTGVNTLLFDCMSQSVNSNVQVWRVFLLWAYVGTYCANCADTWSSEVGILSTEEPRFILAPWRRVPYGTNGGVSGKGFNAAMMCGLVYGTITASYVFVELMLKMVVKGDSSVLDVLHHYRIPVLSIFFLTVFASMFGTLFDSVLGALLEYSGFSKRKDKIVKEYDESEDFNGNLVHISGLNVLSGCEINYLSGVVTGLCTGLLAVYIL